MQRFEQQLAPRSVTKVVLRVLVKSIQTACSWWWCASVVNRHVTRLSIYQRSHNSFVWHTVKPCLATGHPSGQFRSGGPDRAIRVRTVRSWTTKVALHSTVPYISNSQRVFDVYVSVLNLNSLTKNIFHVYVFVSVTIPAKSARYVYLIQNRWCSELFTYMYV